MAEKEDKSTQENKSKNLGEPFPPELELWEKILYYGAYLIGIAALISSAFPGYTIFHTYIKLSLILVAIIITQYFRHKIDEHIERLEDPSYIEAIFVEVRTIAPRLGDPERPKDFETKKKELLAEKGRLETIGNKGWTEYQTLSVSQLLIDFLNVDDLIARAKSVLADLEEYTDDSLDEFDKEQYKQWEKRIDNAIKIINKARVECSEKNKENDLIVDNCAEQLRAEARDLLESVANYDLSWAKGTALIKALRITGVLFLPILLAMGILPLYFPDETKALGLINWGWLGILGAVSAVLLSLRKSDIVLVGLTEGKLELSRAKLGITLGLVAGVLMYSMIAGGLVNGSLFPNIDICGNQICDTKDIALSIFWGIASGIGLEKIFERVSSTAGTIGKEY